MLKDLSSKDIKVILKGLDTVDSSLAIVIKDIITKNKKDHPNFFDYIAKTKLDVLEQKNKILQEQNETYIKLLKEIEEEIDVILQNIHSN